MFFALSTDDKSLTAFETEAEAVAYAEGIDVENSIWLFFDKFGQPLKAVFTTPNDVGRFSIKSGKYFLQPGSGITLIDLLPQVVSIDGNAELKSVSDVANFLASNPSYMDSPKSTRN